MRLEDLVRADSGDPWLITESAHRKLSKLLEALSTKAIAVREAKDIFGSAVEVPQMRVEDGLAIIPVAGILARKVTDFEKIIGFTDTLDIISDVRQAASNPDVEAIVFDIDSPGGTVAGTQEAAQAIRSAGKKTLAYASGEMCSAAYWLAASADEVWASPSSVVGSVGVYMPVYDASRRLEAEGYKVEVFKSGKFKGMGIPGTSLDSEQRQLLQSQIDAIGGQFRGWVRSCRPDADIAAEDMEGQSFLSQEAQNKGFVDHVTSNWGEDFDQTG